MVAYAASLMGIGDFELFTRALEIWHGGPPAESVVENSFSAYLRDGEIPFWVRDYVRKVLADPERCRRERRRRIVALILYYVPLALMFAVIMYFTAR